MLTQPLNTLNQQEGYTALIQASFYCHLTVVQALLESGAAIDIQNNVSVFGVETCPLTKNPQLIGRIYRTYVVFFSRPSRRGSGASRGRRRHRH
jgi:hypothetical protein